MGLSPTKFSPRCVQHKQKAHHSSSKKNRWLFCVKSPNKTGGPSACAGHNVVKTWWQKAPSFLFPEQQVPSRYVQERQSYRPMSEGTLHPSTGPRAPSLRLCRFSRFSPVVFPRIFHLQFFWPNLGAALVCCGKGCQRKPQPIPFLFIESLVLFACDERPHPFVHGNAP